MANFLRPKRLVLRALLICGIVGMILYGAAQLGQICPDDETQACQGFEYGENLEQLRIKFRKAQAEGMRERAKTDCEGFPDTSNILLIMKTGASEAWNKIPTHLNTNLRCKEDFLIFSDMAQIIDNVPVHDSLNSVLPELSGHHPDFELYRRQQSCPIDQATCNKEENFAEEGWALDKYKNIHMAEKAYAIRPGFDWYLFVDADSYVIWPTIAEWLNRIDAHGKIYTGSRAMLGDLPFAHGGSGYLVSNGLMKDMFGVRASVANGYDLQATQICCGDALFSHAVQNETGVEVTNVWPTVNGEKAGTLEYGPKQWCQPLVTMHHIGSQEVSEFDALERSRGYSSPMRIKDVFNAFIRPNLVDSRWLWDNQSDGVHLIDWSMPAETFSWLDSSKVRSPTGLPQYQKEAHLSPDSCQLACKSLVECLQWRFYRGVCSLSSTVRMGRPRNLMTQERLTSGWEVERIEAWAREHDDCGEVVWPQVA